MERPCERCGGGALICSAVSDTPMRCPEPTYDDEFDLLGVCPHLAQCPACVNHPGDARRHPCNSAAKKNPK